VLAARTADAPAGADLGVDLEVPEALREGVVPMRQAVRTTAEAALPEAPRLAGMRHARAVRVCAVRELVATEAARALAVDGAVKGPAEAVAIRSRWASAPVEAGSRRPAAANRDRRLPALRAGSRVVLAAHLWPFGPPVRRNGDIRFSKAERHGRTGGRPS
jgi:hypothetical protein